jgi:hypothetical protein
MSLMLFSLLSVATTSHQTVASELNAVRSYYLAREGLSRAMAELANNETYASAPVSINIGPGQGSYTVTAVAAPNNVGNSLKAWVVTATGSYGTATRTLRAWVGQQSFSRYMYYSNLEMPNNYWITGNSFSGPTHTNGHFNFYGHPGFSDQTTSSNIDEASTPASSGHPFDSTAMTYDPNMITGQDAVGTRQPVFTNPSQFYHAYNGDYANTSPVALNGATNFTFAGGQSRIDLPSTNQVVSQTANQTFNGDTTFVFNSTGTVTITPSSGGSQTVSLSAPMVFAVSNGNAYIKGTVKGRATVTASGTSPTTSDPYNYVNYERTNLGTGNVFFTGDTYYNDQNQDVLGVVAQNNVVIKPPSTQTNITLTGSIMAIDGILMADQWWTGSYRGSMTLTGGSITVTQSLMGTFNPSTGKIVTGYNEVYNIDPRLASIPPPSFPTTGKVTLKGMVDTGALGN